MWADLGFKQSPYDVKPLSISKADAELLVGRKDEALRFATILESSDGGAFIVAGRPGVGKTSFLNVQQYLLWSRTASFGPRVVPCFRAYSVQPNDTAKDICLGCLDSLIFSIERISEETGKGLSSSFKTIRGWRQGAQKVAGATISVLGVGGGITRTFQSPSVSDAPLDLICDMINTLVREVLAPSDFDSVVVSIDNIDNLNPSKVPEVFIALRDNLFVIQDLWTLAIGQANLMSIVRAEAPKAAERVLGFLEMSPLELDEVTKAIDSRVGRFSNRKGGTAPISSRIHELIYEASSGEIRFTFQTCNLICQKFIEDMRSQLISAKEADDVSLRIEDLIAEHLVNNEIPDNTCEFYLEKMVLEVVKAFNLTRGESHILTKICQSGSVANKNWKACGADGARPFEQTCSKFVELGLLSKTKVRGEVRYEPAGLLALAHKLHLSLVDTDQE